jgi:hypothetical protein
MDESPKILPKGIFFEAARQRWRVRVYKQGLVIYLSYHKTLEDALTGWYIAKTRQRFAIRRKSTHHTDSIHNLLHSIQDSLRPEFTVRQN